MQTTSVSTRLINSYIASKADAEKMEAMLVEMGALATVEALPGCVDSRQVVDEEQGGVRYLWEITFEDLDKLSDYMRSETRTTELLPVLEKVSARFAVEPPAPPPAAAPPPAPGSSASSLPGPIAEKLGELSLTDPTTLPAEARAEVLSTAATGALVVFLLPLFGNNFLLDASLSSIVGGGLLGYAALRQDKVGETSRKAGAAVLQGVEKAQELIKDKL